MTRFNIAFSPELPLAVILVVLAIAGAFAMYGLWRRLRGELDDPEAWFAALTERAR